MPDLPAVEFVKYLTQERLQKKFNSSREKRINCDIFDQKLRMEDVSFIYFEQIVSFCAIIYKIPKVQRA